MAMKKHNNTYGGGLNNDTAFDSIPSKMYIGASDIRITTADGESTGAITNIQGNEESFNINQAGATGVKEIIGVGFIRNTILIFCADDADNGWIYYLIYDEQTREMTNLGTGMPPLLYDGNGNPNLLNFSKDWPIEAQGRYESDCVQRIYWTDYNNPLRSILIEGFSAIPVGGITIDISVIDIFPNVTYTQPIVETISFGGELLCGEYQFAYRLITPDGKQTLISPPGNLVHLTSDSDQSSTTRTYMGDPKGTNTFKSIQIRIDTTDYVNIYEQIELIAVVFEDFGATPVIQSVETLGIGVLNEITFTYTGSENTIVDLTLEEFAIKVYPFSTCKTLVPKDNSLVVANIKQTKFDVNELLEPGETLDLLTKRYNSAQQLPFTDGPLPNPGGGNYTELDEMFNLPYNLDQHWEGWWHKDQQFKYREDGSSMGGQSLDDGVNPSNIDYYFTLNNNIIDNSSEAGIASLDYTLAPNPEIIDLNDGYSYTNKSYKSHASPYKSGLVRGYKRGEVYRFGIVFYNKKGESSYVEYIGDIKMPDLSEEAGYFTTDTPTNKTYFPISSDTHPHGDENSYVDDNTYGHDLGLLFNLDFTSCPSLLSDNKITSFQIVRCKRTDADKRRVSQGIIKSFYYPGLGVNPQWDSEMSSSRGYKWGDKEHIIHLKVAGPGEEYAISDENIGGAFGSTNKITNVTDGMWRSFNNDWFNYYRGQSLRNFSPIFGNYLAFYSPEISYNFNDQPAIGGGKGLLITGSYDDYCWNEGDDGGAKITTRYWSNTINYGDGELPFPRDGLKKNQELGCWIHEERRKVRGTTKIVKTVAKGEYDDAPTPILYRGVEYWKEFAEASIRTQFKKANEDTTRDDHAREDIVQELYGPYDMSGEALYLRPNYVCTWGQGKSGSSAPPGTPGNDCSCNVSEPACYGGPDNCGGGGIGRGGSCLLTKITTTFINPYSLDPVSHASTGVSFAVNDTSAASIAPDGLYCSQTIGPGGHPETFNYVEASNPSYLEDSDGTNIMPYNTPIVDVVAIKKEIYGGYTPSALENNIFVPSSPVIHLPTFPTVTVSNFKVFGGDTFVGMFTLQTKSVVLDEALWPEAFASTNDRLVYSDNIGTTEAIPMESSINVALGHGGTLKTNSEAYWVEGGVAYVEGFLRQEIGNLSQGGGSSCWAKIMSAYDNAYNTVYSVEPADNTLGFFIKPGTASGCGVNDIRAFLSDVKINEEAVDSWSIFRANSFYDTEAQFGPINKIVNWKDEVYFFQDTGLGKYSINPRAVTTTEDGIPTQLGSGQGFQHHQYLSTENGSIHQWAVTTTDTGIYYFDAMNKKIFRVGSQGNEPLSVMKGMHGFLSSFNGVVLRKKETEQAIGLGGDNPGQFRGVTFTRDQQNDEVLMTFLGMYKIESLTNSTHYEAGTIVIISGAPTQYWIVYESYTSDAVALPPALQAELATKSSWVDTDTREGRALYALLEKGNGGKATVVFDEVAQVFSSFYSATPGTYIENSNILISTIGDIGYTHNKGKYGEFYGAIQESSITLVVNPEADLNKILRFIEFGSQVREIGGDIDRTQTITAFRVENEYQDTNKTAYSPANIKRRFDKWRIKLPRDQKSSSKKGRLRSTHFIVTLYYDNTINKELILNRITSHYDVQMY